MMASSEQVEGVVFGKSIRAGYAILHVASEGKHVVIRLQFPPLDDESTNLPSVLRSWSRRCCKMGDLIHVRGKMQEICFWLEVNSLEMAQQVLCVTHVRYWPAVQWQEWQRRYCPQKSTIQQYPPKKVKTDNKTTNASHGSRLAKRKQGECVANFVIQVLMQRNEKEMDTSVFRNEPLSKSDESCVKAIEALNKGTGVIDAAGGCGYVSMAFGLQSVKSTIVDPRESVGVLPKRDRKVWKRALKQARTIQFDTMRAWFGQPPPNDVDRSFRHVHEEEDIPVCGRDHFLVKQCSAIVALHPDEATDAIVDLAIQQRVPFFVVPCCVFSRLFPNRRLPNGGTVSTYEDLLNYLSAKHESIQRTTLPFEGANVALWSVF